MKAMAMASLAARSWRGARHAREAKIGIGVEA
jgi:hypothetical protein